MLHLQHRGAHQSKCIVWQVFGWEVAKDGIRLSQQNLFGASYSYKDKDEYAL